MSEPEMIGWVVIALVAIVGLYFTVSKPMLENQKTMTELTCVMRELKEKFVDLESGNQESHKKIWNRLEKHDDSIQDHETRIKVLEKEDK